MSAENAKTHEGGGAAWERDDDNVSGCCCRTARHHRIAPLSGQDPFICEVRPKRYLRILHINGKPRDESFEKEYEDYLNKQNRKTELRTKKMQIMKANRLKKMKTQSLESDIQNKHSVSKDKESVHISSVSNEKSSKTEDKLDKTKLPGTKHSEDSNFTNTQNEQFTGTDKSQPVSDFDSKRVNSPTMNETVPKDSFISIVSRKSTSATLNNVSIHVNSSLNHKQDKGLEERIKSLPPELCNSLFGSRENSFSKNRIITDETNAVIFFIHGVGGSSDVWQGQTEYLRRQGYEMVIPDLIGHGFSFAPQNSKAYDFKEISQDLFAIFDKYCKKRNVIIGHSYG